MCMSDTTNLKIAMLGHKRIPSREGGWLNVDIQLPVIIEKDIT